MFGTKNFPSLVYGLWRGIFGGLPNYIKLTILGYGGEVFSYNGELYSQYVLASLPASPLFCSPLLCSV